jgi:thiol peroxidase
MQERTNVTSFNGTSLTLLGPELKVGDKAPDFQVVDPALEAVSLADFADKIKIVCTVPSLDTPVCDREVRRFNQEAAQLSDSIVILTISLDLPFAQKSWCAAAGIERIKVLSDYQDRTFSFAYGVFIKELCLTSRSIFIIDAENVIQYIQHVPEIGEEPDYAAVLATTKSMIVTKEAPGDEFCGGY